MASDLDVARSSNNSLLPLLLDPIHRLIPDIKSSVYKTVDDARDSALIWHMKITERILRRDAEGARAAMVGYLRIAEKHTLRMLRAQRSADPRPNRRS